MEYNKRLQRQDINYYFQTLYMDAARLLPDDLQDIVDLMVEKEIRVRAPLEEIELLMQE